MLLKIAIGIAVLFVAFMAYVSTRPDNFEFERSGVINAPAAKIFPYISQFRLGAQWSPYEQKDVHMKKTITSNDGEVGAIETFEGNSQVGAGSLEFLKIVPNQSVQIRLLMSKPMRADNLVEYTLQPEGSSTRFTWKMSGKSGFMGKLVSVFIDCDKMLAGDFEKGVQNLKSVVESAK